MPISIKLMEYLQQVHVRTIFVTHDREEAMEVAQQFPRILRIQDLVFASLPRPYG
jgi:ABC-type sulfate/molybdate transport systems ATPase subunit